MVAHGEIAKLPRCPRRTEDSLRLAGGLLDCAGCQVDGFDWEADAESELVSRRGICSIATSIPGNVRGRSGYRPFQTGLRFSANARAPSRLSSDEYNSSTFRRCRPVMRFIASWNLLSSASRTISLMAA